MYRDGKSIDQIAEAMSWSQKAVRSKASGAHWMDLS